MLRAMSAAKAQREPGTPGDKAPLPLTASALVTLHAARVPLAFQILGSGDSVEISWGIWTTKPDEGIVSGRLPILKAALSSAYEDLEVRKARPARGWDHCALALGVPSSPSTGRSPEGNAVDRVIRAMRGQKRWLFLCLAQRVTDGGLDAIVADLGKEQADLELPLAAGLPRRDPILKAALEEQLERAQECQVTGAWRTALYLSAEDVATLSALRASVTSMFLDASQKVDPLRTHAPEHGALARLVRTWTLPDVEIADRSSFGHLRRYAYQSLLSSAELACYLQLPDVEVPGFSRISNPAFDSVQSTEVSNGFDLGRILRGRQPTSAPYAVDIDELSRHALVCGVTGSGKTSTVRHLIDEVGLPYLVIEPTKTEYRSLATEDASVTVITCGDEVVAPLRLNPFEAADPRLLQTHVERLKALFSATFALWSPLPQLLERAILECYESRGYDVSLGKASRGADFPTLTDVTRRVEQIMGDLSYSGEVAGNMRAALLARLEGLLIGNRGLMLDTREHLPDEALFDARVVVELETIGDDDDKCFLMGLLLIRLAEFRRLRGPNDKLQHLLVIEEAHRLLSAASESNQAGFGSPKAKAVEAFTNMLAEVRSYGQGMVIADQVPTRLAPEVLKNTNLKIAHRTVARDDREALAATMAMDDERSLALATLTKGQAGVFAEGDDAPLLIAVEWKGTLPAPTEGLLRERFTSWTKAWRLRWSASSGLGVGREAAKRLASSDQTVTAVVRMLVSAQHDTLDHLRTMYNELALRLDRVAPAGIEPADWRRSVLSLTTSQLVVELSAAHGWSPSVALRATQHLTALLTACDKYDMTGRSGAGPEALDGLRKLAPELWRVPASDPSACPHCAKGCCAFAFAAARLLRQPRWRQVADGIIADYDRAVATSSDDELRSSVSNQLRALAQEIIRVPEAWDAPGEPTDIYGSVTAAALCLWQQANLTDPQRSAWWCARSIAFFTQPVTDAERSAP